MNAAVAVQSIANAILVDVDQLPEPVRAAYQREAMRRGVGVDQLFREALSEKAQQIMGDKSPARAVG